MKRLAALLLGLMLAACMAADLPEPPGTTMPQIVEEALVMRDGWRLPMTAWVPDDPPRAVIVAVHGMNDYANAFAMPGPWWAQRGITTYAYDQRGFGRGEGRGLWHGGARMARDLVDVVKLIRARHPGVPLYLLGESMGGAVALVAVTEPDMPPLNGLILSAPAVRSRATMGALQRGLLWITSTLFPGGTVTGQGVYIPASDNEEMLRALGRDPLMVRATRSDSVAGLVNLMDAAMARLGRLPENLPVLLLYGRRDQFVPRGPTDYFAERLRQPRRLMAYPDGWHLLLRDLKREVVWADVVAFTADPRAPLPSGVERAEPPLFPED